MAVTDTDQVKPGTTEWAIYAALKQGGTLMSTALNDALEDWAHNLIAALEY